MTDLAVDCRDPRRSPASSVTTRSAGDELGIEFDRSKGGKPFDINVEWFRPPCWTLGQPPGRAIGPLSRTHLTWWRIFSGGWSPEKRRSRPMTEFLASISWRGHPYKSSMARFSVAFESAHLWGGDPLVCVVGSRCGENSSQ